ncbi:MAG: type I phosphomannose isomerase catalytic subunit [Acidimicrobiales bacterium]
MRQLATDHVALYPLRFEPIYEYRPWGGRQLAGLLTQPLPDDGPIGEAWVLSDRPDYQSRVADGPLQGQTISQLLEQFPQHMLGPVGPWTRRFPLLLKFLDARELLSVQVHPADGQTAYLPDGDTSKTEAWGVLEADLDRESIWISYSPMALEGDGPYRLGPFRSHHRLAAPVSPWERVKVGGTPPVLTRRGWLIIYHGVIEVKGPATAGHGCATRPG